MRRGGPALLGADRRGSVLPPGHRDRAPRHQGRERAHRGLGEREARRLREREGLAQPAHHRRGHAQLQQDLDGQRGHRQLHGAGGGEEQVLRPPVGHLVIRLHGLPGAYGFGALRDELAQGLRAVVEGEVAVAPRVERGGERPHPEDRRAESEQPPRVAGRPRAQGPRLLPRRAPLRPALRGHVPRSGPGALADGALPQGARPAVGGPRGQRRGPPGAAGGRGPRPAGGPGAHRAAAAHGPQGGRAGAAAAARVGRPAPGARRPGGQLHGHRHRRDPGR
mmetsp:Transcript_123259/g.343787  ORF Transcript_123259/g.343787 Transcript_123259/m.343787 type:complete len:279 (-) Transcript_123259:39-875(-)